MSQSLDFAECFQGLTGHQPLRWQTRLHKGWLEKGICPAACTLPTGLGKTAVIPIWLIALAGGARLPRRCVYIVNRRTVVDQATDVARRLLGRIYRSGRRDHLPWATDEAIAAHGLTQEPPPPDEHAPAVATLRKALSCLSGDDSAAPLAISTLRGELADNGEWKQNPARPAIIVGTIDMIGSKLLFSGYGDGRYGRAHHAGLIGQDALIVHDEAHLSPAFDELLRVVAAEQKRTNEARPIRVMRLSATTRAIGNAADGTSEEFGLDDTDNDDTVVMQRVTASKRLRFVEIDTVGKKDSAFTGKIAEHALAHETDGCRVLVYVRSPETAEAVRAAIIDRIVEKTKQAGPPISEDDAQTRVGLLTGTLRGYERDKLADSNLFKAFQSGSDRSAPLPHTLYLVSTSAGEVGADWDADHLVCDLTTLDSMAQRFGRVNRLGGDGRSAQIVVVVEKAVEPAEGKAAKKPNPYAAAVVRTGEILRSIADNSGDVSPAALTKAFDGLSAGDKRAAFSPEPTILPATDILFDHWSLTSIAGRLPGRPEVAPYLHGVAEWEPPETYVAWRAEVSELASAGVANEALEEILDVFPLRAAEKLRDRSDRVFEALRAIADRLRNDSDLSEQEKDPAVILIRQNAVQWTTLSKIAPADFDKKRISDSPLTYATIILPVEVGGLKNGMLVGSARPPDEPKTLDVAEAQATGQRKRQRVWIKADDFEAPLIGDAAAPGLASKLRIKLSDDEGDEMEDEQAAGSRIAAIEYRVEKNEGGEPGQRVALKAHNEAVAANAEQIAKALALPDELIQAFRLAGEMHDQGKDRDLWQYYARNPPQGQNPVGAIAKSDRYGGWQMLGGYRHEFGSLLDAAMTDEIKNHPQCDLILHLVAAHHGWGRPHFERHAFDKEKHTAAQNEKAAVKAVQRFARLQQRFGRWGMAWLESLLRSADALASSEINTGDAE